MDILLLARPETALINMETLEEQKMLVEQMEDLEDIRDCLALFPVRGAARAIVLPKAPDSL